MIDREGRKAFRKRAQEALDVIAGEEARGEGERAFFRPFRVQLEALLTWTKDEADPDPELLERITIGNLALRELGEEPEDVDPKLLGLWESLKTLQTNVMDWYVRFD